MKPFNEKSRCAKCGFGDAASRYEPAQYVPYILELMKEEHIKRTCVRCGFTWKEACLDQPSKQFETGDATAKAVAEALYQLSTKK